MPNQAQRMMKNATSTDDLGLDAQLLHGCEGCAGMTACREGERCWNCGQMLPVPNLRRVTEVAPPAPGAYLITDAQLADLIQAASLLTSASEEPQAQQARELVRGVVQAARKVGE